MTARRLHEFAADLGLLRDQLREAGDEAGAERLDEPIAQVHELADKLDELLGRLGNPPTDLRRKG